MAARELTDRRCENATVLDVRGLSQVCDFVVVATGTSDRQAQSAGHFVEDLGKALGFEKLASDADAQTKWVVVDFAAVMVHVFEPATRAGGGAGARPPGGGCLGGPGRRGFPGRPGGWPAERVSCPFALSCFDGSGLRRR